MISRRTDAMQVRQTILGILEQLTETPAAEISPDDHLISDLGFDSVDAVEFLGLVSDALDIEIEVHEVAGVQTVGDVFRLVEP
jgi:acyl carrier protein